MREFKRQSRVLLIDDNADHLRGVKELIHLKAVTKLLVQQQVQILVLIWLKNTDLILS